MTMNKIIKAIEWIVRNGLNWASALASTAKSSLNSFNPQGVRR
jgi:hypothetical protein